MAQPQTLNQALSCVLCCCIPDKVSPRYFREDIPRKVTIVDSAPLDQKIICWYVSSGFLETKQQRSQGLWCTKEERGEGEVSLAICLHLLLHQPPSDPRTTWLRPEGHLEGRGNYSSNPAQTQLWSTTARSIVPRLDIPKPKTYSNKILKCPMAKTLNFYLVSIKNSSLRVICNRSAEKRMSDNGFTNIFNTALWTQIV